MENVLQLPSLTSWQGSTHQPGSRLIISRFSIDVCRSVQGNGLALSTISLEGIEAALDV